MKLELESSRLTTSSSLIDLHKERLTDRYERSKVATSSSLLDLQKESYRERNEAEKN